MEKIPNKKGGRGLNIALTIVSVLFIGVSGTLLTKYIIKKRRERKKDPKNFKVTTKDNFWDKMLYGVISVEYGFNTPCNSFYSKGCRGKRYTDVLHLDSGTVGIAHFASGGLEKLYDVMDTEKLFGRSKSEMKNNYANKKSKASDNQWWVDGMREWVNNRENDKIQDRLFIESRQRAIDAAKANGWKTDREFAIAAGISNSYGNSGFIREANKRDWDAEKVLHDYTYKFGENDFSNHKNKRKIQIDKWFPKSREKKINL